MSTPSGSMQAALLYGPRQVALETLPIPALGDTDVLVRIEAATTCGTDLKVFLQGGHARMITLPAVFGHIRLEAALRQCRTPSPGNTL